MAKNQDIYDDLEPYQLDQLRTDLEKWRRKLPKQGPSMADEASAAAKGSIVNRMKRAGWRTMENLSRYGEGAAWLPAELLKAPGSIDQALGGKPGFLQDVKQGTQHIQDELHHGTQFFQEMAGVPKEESALPTSERYIPTWLPEVAGSFTQPAPYLAPIKKLLSRQAIKPAIEGASKMAAYGAGVSSLGEFNKPEADQDWMNVPKTAAVMAGSSPIFQRLMGAFTKTPQAQAPPPPGGGPSPGWPGPAGPGPAQIPQGPPRNLNPMPPGPPPPPRGAPPSRQITDYIDVPYETMPPMPPKPAPIQLPYLEPPGTPDAFAKTRGSSMRMTDLLPDDLNVNMGPRDPFLVKQPEKISPASQPDASLDALAGEVRPSLVKPHDMIPTQLEVNQGPRQPFLIKNEEPFMGGAPKTIQKGLPAQPELPGIPENKAFGDSLIDFLRGKGGLQDHGGEVSKMEVPGKLFNRNLVQDQGLGLDSAAEMAHEAGYLPERNINSLLDSIDREARGNPTYAPGNVDPAAESQLFEHQFARDKPYNPADAEYMIVPEEPIHPSDIHDDFLPPLEDTWGNPTAPLRESGGGLPTKSGQQSIDIPPPTIGQRPLIGREVSPQDDAPLFNLSQREPAPEQGSMFGEQPLYHGTWRDFTEFNRLQEAKNRNEKQIDTLGSWFTSDPTSAKQYGPKVIPANLSVKKPLVFTGDENQGGFKALREAVQREGGVEAFREKAKAEGYDGIKIVGDKLDHFEGDVHVAFDPDQIKILPADTVPDMFKSLDEEGHTKWNLGPGPARPNEAAPPTPDMPAGHEAAHEVSQEMGHDVDMLGNLSNLLNDERGSTHLGGGVGPIERVLTQRRFAEKHPQDFGPVYRKALDRFEWQAAQKHDLHQLGKPYYLLDPADRKVVDQFLRDRRRMRATSLPASLKPAADAIDKVMESSYDLINSVRAVKGMAPMQHDPFYIPFARSGDYLTIATLPNGKKWVSAATTLREAEAMEKRLVAQHPGVNVLVKTTAHKKGDLPTLDFGTLALLEKAGIIDAKDFEQAVSQFDLPPGFSSHMRNAQKILGESADLLDPIERYIDGVTNYTARFLHDDDMKGMIDTIKDPAVKQYAEQYRDYLNTKPQEYSRLRGAVAVWDLSLNIGSMFQNATQVPFVGFPVIESHIGKVGAAKVFKDSIKALLNPSPQDQHILDMAEREGHIRPINAEELFGARGAPGQELQFGSPYVQRQIEKGWLPQPVGKGIRAGLDFAAGGTEKLLAKGGDLNLAIGQKLSYAMHRLTGSSAPIAADKATRAHPVLMQGFASIEEANRRLGILLGYRTGEAMGMTPAESYEFSKTISRNINYDYSPASRAQAFRGMGAPLGLFMTFQTEYMATMSKLIRQQVKSPGFKKMLGPATSALVGFWALAGIKGLPFVEDLDLYGPEAGMLSQNLPDWFYQGPLSAATDRDISAKFKMGPRVPYDMLHGTVDASQIPVAQPFVNFAQGTDWFLDSPKDAPSAQKYVERLLPPAARHTAQAARWAGFGPAGEIENGTVGTMRGHTPGPTEDGKRDFFHPSTTDIVGKAGSFTPLELSKQYSRGRIQQRMQQAKRTNTTALVNAAAHHLDRNGQNVPSPALEQLRKEHPHTYQALMKAHARRQSGAEQGSTEEIYRKKQEPKVIQ